MYHKTHRYVDSFSRNLQNAIFFIDKCSSVEEFFKQAVHDILEEIGGEK